MNKYLLVYLARHTGAVIRATPDVRGADRGRVRPGQSFYGDPVYGERVTIRGYGTSPVWIASGQGYVWSGMLRHADH